MIIAHRMRTVAEADKIVVLKDGVAAEQGSPAELETPWHLSAYAGDADAGSRLETVINKETHG